jgi:hypothetical protein
MKIPINTKHQQLLLQLLLQLRDISLAGAREIGLIPFSMKNAILWAQALPPN